MWETNKGSQKREQCQIHCPFHKRCIRNTLALTSFFFIWCKCEKAPLLFCIMFLNTLLFCLSVASLLNTFSVFGPLKVEWPGKDGKHPRCPPQGNSKIHLQIHLQFSCISYWVSAKRTNMETYLRFNHIKLYVSDLKHGFLGSPQFWWSTLFWNFVDS